MSTAAKLRKKAAELEQQKQYDKAVQTYKRALEDEERDGDEPDVQLYNRIGDLLIRQGSVAEAVNYLEKAVDLYTASDLHNNAIALCNKILRHTPGRSGIYHTLGRICARKGLRGDATRNFVEYASRMQQAGRTDEALAALTEFVDLVPENTEFRALLDTHVATVGRSTAATSAGAVAAEGGLTVLDTSGSRITPPIGLAGVAAAAKPASALPTNGAVHSAYVVKPAPVRELIFLSVEFDSPAIPGTAPRTTPELDAPRPETLAVTPLVAEPVVVVLEAPVAPVADLQVFAELSPEVVEETTAPVKGFESTRAVDGLLLITDAMGGALAGLELTRLDVGDVSMAPTFGALAGLESNRVESPAEGVSIIADDRQADVVAVAPLASAAAAEVRAPAAAQTLDVPAVPIPAAAPAHAPAPHTPAPRARLVVPPLRTPPSLDGLLLLEDGRLTPPVPATAVTREETSADAVVTAATHDLALPTSAEPDAVGDADVVSPMDELLPTIDATSDEPLIDPIAIAPEWTGDHPAAQDEALDATVGANHPLPLEGAMELASVEELDVPVLELIDEDVPAIESSTITFETGRESEPTIAELPARDARRSGPADEAMVLSTSAVEEVIERSAIESIESIESVEQPDAVANVVEHDEWSVCIPAADDVADIVDAGQPVDAPLSEADLAVEVPLSEADLAIEVPAPDADLAFDAPTVLAIADIDHGGVDEWASTTALFDAELALVPVADALLDMRDEADTANINLEVAEAIADEPVTVELSATDEHAASETDQSLAVVSAAEVDVLVGAGPLLVDDVRSFTPIDSSAIHATWESPEREHGEDIIDLGGFDDLHSLSLGPTFDSVEIDGEVLLPALDEHASRAFWAHDPHDLALPGELPPLELPGTLDTLSHQLLPAAIDDDDYLRIDFAWESLDDVYAEPASASEGPSVALATQGEAVAPDAPDLLDDLLDIAPPAPAIDGSELDGGLAGMELAPAVGEQVPTERASDVGVAAPLNAEFAAVGDDLLDAMFATAPADLAPDRSLAALRIAVARAPYDWPARRRLTDALFECGDVEHAIAVLTETSTLLEERGRLAEAAQATEEIVRVRPDLIDGHQRRVELAVRANDASRLSVSYLDLADALVRLGEAPKAQAVYLRVLELDPFDQRARAALGPSAPPAPAQRPKDEYVELGAWLKDEGPSTRFTMPAPEPTGDEDADFQQLLQRFKEGVAQAVGDEDHESHYDLGVAYKEMGLTEDAIAEFQKALRSRQNRLRSYEALGQCFVEQRNYQVAVTVMHRALQEPGVDEEQLVGVLFLLGYASEALQRWPEARGYYERVVATDITFRDVAARLAALDRLTTR